MIHRKLLLVRTHSQRITRVLVLLMSLGTFVVALPARAQTRPSDPAADARLSLNGTWRFALAQTEEDAQALEPFHKADFDAKAFKPVPVPSNWAVLGFEEPVYRGFTGDKASEGFYLHDFTPPAQWNDKRILLHFGGVWSSAEVWLNGKQLGRHDSGYTSFAFDVSGDLKPGQVNRLAVRVRQVTREYKSDVFDDWTLGGIYREVFLEAMPRKRWLDRVTATTTFDDQFADADLKLRVMVGDKQRTTLPGNYASPGEAYDLRFVLLSADNTEVARRQITVPAHIATDRETSVAMHIERPRQWTAETPYLYTLRVELIDKGSITHTRTERIGFRQISTAGGVFRINGQPVKLRGVNRHDEHPDVGRATTREHWIQDIAMMKAANINYIRLAHYTPARGFIELCDEMGMYVGNEVSLGGAGDLMYNPAFAAGVLLRSYETVIRDINSPSIVYWSIGNEDPLTSLQLAGVHTVKGLDSTRPVLLPWRFEEWLPPEVDILAPHYWKPHEYDTLAANSTRPIITTEYTHAYGTHGLGGLEARWKALTRHPAGAGGAVWLWADQGIKMPTPKPGGLGDEYQRLTADGWDGIVDAYRKPTRDYWEVKAVYAQVYPAIDKVSFVPGQKTVRIPIQNDYDFTDLNAVKITWSIRGNDRELAGGTSQISGRPHAAAAFELPLEALQSVRADVSYYAWFVFTDAGGVEINRRAVELLPPAAVIPAALSATKPTVTKGDTVAVQSGDSRFVFNPKTGQLVSASLKGKQLLTNLRPVIWRPLDSSEQMVVGSAAARNASDLNRYEPSATAWEVEEGTDQITIRSKVDYPIDEQNRFAATYVYSVGAEGILKVQYEILPKVVVPCVPVVGMTVQSAPELAQLRWFGLGPYDAYPNKRTAPILGIWGGAAGSLEVTGTKAMRWFERTGDLGGFRVTNDGYFEHDKDDPSSVRILSAVLGRPEKGRKADESIPQLSTDTGEPFVGEFSIRLK